MYLGATMKGKKFPPKNPTQTKKANAAQSNVCCTTCESKHSRLTPVMIYLATAIPA